MCWIVKAESKVRVVCLTELVEVRVDAVRSGYRADQPGLDERAPFVHQNSLASDIILAINDT